MKNYDKEFVVARLIENGLKPVYKKKSNQLDYFLKPRNGIVGIKLLGYLDFLGLKSYEKKQK